MWWAHTMVCWWQLTGTSTMVKRAQTKRPDLINRSLVLPLVIGLRTKKWWGWKVWKNRESMFSCFLVLLPAGCTAIIGLSCIEHWWAPSPGCYYFLAATFSHCHCHHPPPTAHHPLPTAHFRHCCHSRCQALPPPRLPPLLLLHFYLIVACVCTHCRLPPPLPPLVWCKPMWVKKS